MSDLIETIYNECRDIIDSLYSDELMPHPTQNTQQQQSDLSPYIEIIQQPPRKVRYRYESEQLKRSSGTILAISDSNGTKHYPTIKIKNYEGRVNVRVSCVSERKPYNPHYHKIVSKNKDKSNNGIFYQEINQNDGMMLTLTNVGIQRTKNEHIQKSLDDKKKRKIDPFRTGFSPDLLSPHSVRLCFEASIVDNKGNIERLEPVVSEEIMNDRPGIELVICNLSHTSAPATGGMEMILLCDKVNKDKIQVVFSEFQDENVVWHAFAKFKPQDVHKQYAIKFKTPSYKTEINEPVKVKIQLYDSERKVSSEAYDFMFTPSDKLRKDPDFKKNIMEDLRRGIDPDYNNSTHHTLFHPSADNSVYNPVNVVQCASGVDHNFTMSPSSYMPGYPQTSSQSQLPSTTLNPVKEPHENFGFTERSTNSLPDHNSTFSQIFTMSPSSCMPGYPHTSSRSQLPSTTLNPVKEPHENFGFTEKSTNSLPNHNSTFSQIFTMSPSSCMPGYPHPSSRSQLPSTTLNPVKELHENFGFTERSTNSLPSPGGNGNAQSFTNQIDRNLEPLTLSGLISDLD